MLDMELMVAYKLRLSMLDYNQVRHLKELLTERIIKRLTDLFPDI